MWKVCRKSCGIFQLKKPSKSLAEWAPLLSKANTASNSRRIRVLITEVVNFLGLLMGKGPQHEAFLVQHPSLQNVRDEALLELVRWLAQGIQTKIVVWNLCFADFHSKETGLKSEILQSVALHPCFYEAFSSWLPKDVGACIDYPLLLPPRLAPTFPPPLRPLPFLTPFSKGLHNRSRNSLCACSHVSAIRTLDLRPIHSIYR